MTSNHHAPYDLGYTRATMAVTKRSDPARGSKPQKGCLSSDCSLQLDYMKLESLVIANQNVAVNTFLEGKSWETIARRMHYERSSPAKQLRRFLRGRM